MTDTNNFLLMVRARNQEALGLLTRLHSRHSLHGSLIRIWTTQGRTGKSVGGQEALRIVVMVCRNQHRRTPQFKFHAPIKNLFCLSQVLVHDDLFWPSLASPQHATSPSIT